MCSFHLKELKYDLNLAETGRKVYYTQNGFHTNFFREVASGTMPTILLIRHGQSQANAGLPTSCPKEIELTDRGQKEAEFVARELQKSYPALDVMITSAYRRASQTAEWTLWLFKNTSNRDIPTEIWPVHEFTYLSSWERRNSTVEDRRSVVRAYWERADPAYVDGPESESFEQFIARVRKVKMRLDNTMYDTVAVFSHHQFMCALLWLAEQDSLQMGEQAMRAFKAFLEAHPISNGAIVRVQFETGGERWRYELLTSHIDVKDTGIGPG